MRPTKLLCSLFLVLAALVTACSTKPESEEAPTVGQSSSAIINGTLDTEHEAVIALLLSAGRRCTGTIIQVDPSERSAGSSPRRTA